MAEVIVELRDVRKSYSVHGGRGHRRAELRAVDGIDLVVESGRSVGVVGESGCGKSTTARLLLLLERPTSGLVLFEGSDINAADRRGQLR